MTDSISFRCKACGEEAIVPQPYDGHITGFARVTWLAPSPGSDPAKPLLLDKAPRYGDEHWIAVRFPFAATSDRPFWCLYQPPLSYHNGWGDEPHEIPESSVVECRLLEIKDAEADSARLRVDVLCSIPVPEIGNELAVSDFAGDLLDRFDKDRAWLSSFDRFSHLSYNLEGDAGDWAVIERRRNNHYLLLYGEWSWHYDLFFANNRHLTDAENAIVARAAARSGRS
jgi:hypothetical protein